MSEVLETRGDFRVRLERDEDASNPRKEYDNICSVVTLPSRGYMDRYVHIDDDGGPLADGFLHFIGRYSHWSDAVTAFERWARIFHGAVTLYDTPHDGANAVWYLTRETIERENIAEPMATLKAERDDYRAYAEGDVWGYVVERRIAWVPKEPHDDDREIETWEAVDDCWGMYGREYAEREARAVFDDLAGTAV